MQNVAIVQGRLTNNVEMRYTSNNTPVGVCTIACERDYKPKGADKREADFIDILAWGATAEFISKYFSQGDMIIVNGRIKTSNYTTKDGDRRKKTEIEVDKAYFGGAKRGSSGAAQNASTQNTRQEPEEEFINIPDGVEDSGLPFN